MMPGGQELIRLFGIHALLLPNVDTHAPQTKFFETYLKPLDIEEQLHNPYVHVCMYACMYASLLCVHTNIHICACTYVCIYTYTHAYASCAKESSLV